MMTRKDSMVLGSVCLVAGAAFAAATPAQAGVQFFDNQADFDAAIEAAGAVLKGFDDFPWEADSNDVIAIDDPLDVNTNVPGWIRPGILLDNVTYQSNPHGDDGMALFTPGLFGATADGVAANFFVDSFDILSGPPAGDNHIAIGMQLVSFNNSSAGSSLRVRVYDKEDNLIGTESGISAPASGGGAFLGVLVTGGGTIGRINVYDVNEGFDAEGLYDISVYVSDPCPWDVEDDGSVGVPDLLILLAFWGPCPELCLGDLDGDDNVGVSDLLILLANWGPCP